MQCLGSVHGMRLKRFKHWAPKSADTVAHCLMSGSGRPSRTHLNVSSLTIAANLSSSHRMEAWSGWCKTPPALVGWTCTDAILLLHPWARSSDTRFFPDTQIPFILDPNYTRRFVGWARQPDGRFDLILALKDYAQPMSQGRVLPP